MMPSKKKNVQNLSATTEPMAIESASVNDLHTILDEIKTYEGVIGYIIRSPTSVAIELKDPTKIIDYAILSSSALDSSQEMSELFNLGDVKNIIVEGKNVKVLSLTVDENKVSIFMEKDNECDKILKRLHMA